MPKSHPPAGPSLPKVHLPDGVSLSEWALERRRWQNPRIRILLGTIQLLEKVLDSNYAILHCSPDRLQEVWRQVHEVCAVVRTQLAPLFEQPSVVPAIETARQETRISLSMISRKILTRFEHYPGDVAKHQLPEVRKLLCVGIGQLSSFMQDTFGALMAADPRSTNDVDYYLSQRFPRDIEEAEWLYKSVLNLGGLVGRLAQEAGQLLVLRVERLEREQRVLVGEDWQPAEQFIRRLDELTETLREVLALRGIRFDEMEILDGHSRRIPESCNRLLELHNTACEIIAGIEGGARRSRVLDPTQQADLERCHAVFSRRLAAGARQLSAALKDLSTFTPLWLVEISNRRALLLYQTSEESR